MAIKYYVISPNSIRLFNRVFLDNDDHHDDLKTIFVRLRMCGLSFDVKFSFRLVNCKFKIGVILF